MNLSTRERCLHEKTNPENLEKEGPIMKLIAKTATAAFLCSATAVLADLRVIDVKTHPSQGEVKVISGSSSMLITGPEGLHISLQTSNLIPGNVYTSWLVVFNDPSQCEAAPCTGKDALTRSNIVKSDAGYVGGSIVGPDGELSLAAFQPVGDLTSAFFGRGILSTEGLEVHLILQDHGPVIEGRELEMLSTYRGGCIDDSIPAAFPDTARAQGDEGPNQCRMVQVAVFQPD